MMRHEISKRSLESRERREIVVCYECSLAREEAVSFCDRLAARFWECCSLDVSWWSFPLLKHPRTGEEALHRAATTDVLVFAVNPAGRFPKEIRNWLEQWAHNRRELEGHLVGLMTGSDQTWGDVSEKDFYLRQLAHRAGVDYLTGLPPTLVRPIPDSLDSYHERADKLTSVLDEILRVPGRGVGKDVKS